MLLNFVMLFFFLNGMKFVMLTPLKKKKKMKVAMLTYFGNEEEEDRPWEADD